MGHITLLTENGVTWKYVWDTHIWCCSSTHNFTAIHQKLCKTFAPKYFPKQINQSTKDIVIPVFTFASKMLQDWMLFILYELQVVCYGLHCRYGLEIKHCCFWLQDNFGSCICGDVILDILQRHCMVVLLFAFNRHLTNMRSLIKKEN